MQLISKTQYKDHEDGEFSDIESRSLDATLELIKHFPWDDQRNLTPVGLTCPSVTIEQSNDRFLKLGPYYSGKYCLYFLNEKNELLNRIIENLSDSFQTIDSFYNDEAITTDFKSSSFTANPKKYFVTGLFEYVLTFDRIIRLMAFPLIFIFLILMLSTNIFSDFNTFRDIHVIEITAIFLLLYTGPSFFLLINYSLNSSDFYLKLSKGHDEFYFGEKGDSKQYNKNDIEELRIFSNMGWRNPWSQFCIFEIIFKNGELIRFPNSLISDSLLISKLKTSKTERIHKFLAIFRS